MPANLPPTYYEAEQRFRDAKTAESKVEILEEMLMIMPKHKGTDKLRADLRTRIAKLKKEAQQKKGTGKSGASYLIEKEGAAQVVLMGAPNVGKSSLVAALTNANPEVAAFPHTTWKPLPGMAPFENIQFQLIDMPPVNREYVDPWVADLMRRADMLILVVDLHGDPIQQLDETLSIMADFRIYPRGMPIPPDLRKAPFVKDVLLVVNKMDEEEDEADLHAFLELSETRLHAVGVSTRTRRNLDLLLRELFHMAKIIRVYTKAPGKDPDRKSPFVLPRESTLEDLAAKIHKDFVARLKFAKIWGASTHNGQMVQRDYVLKDGDVVEMHL